MKISLATGLVRSTVGGNKPGISRQAGLASLIAFGVLYAPPLWAQPEPAAGATIETTLRLEANTDCATVAALSERVRARSERIVFAPRAPRAVSVAIAQDSSVWSAELEIRLPDNPAVVRRKLRAQSCAALLDAVGFVVSVTLDPPRADAPIPIEAPPPRSEPVPAETRSETSRPGQGDAKVAEPRGVAEPEQVGDPPTDFDVEDSESRALRSARHAEPPDVTWSFGALGQAAHAAAPSELFGVGAFARVRWIEGWRPSLRLGGAWFSARRWEGEDGVASFELTAFHFDGCPYTLEAGKLDVGLCASFVAARLIAQGVRALQPETHERPWGFWGGGASAALALGPVELSLAFRAGPTWVRDAFQFAPDVFYRVPPWGMMGDLGIGVVLP